MAKTITTRIQNKIDLFDNWKGKSGLLKGEIALVQVPTGQSVTNPVTGKTEPVVELLMKVGDGSTSFNDLPWLSAKASDVYNWAKSATVELDTTNKKLLFKDTNSNTVHSVAFDYATQGAVDAIDTRVTNLESKFTGDGSVQGKLDALDVRLDTLEGTGAGSVAKALADAKTYADQAEADALSAAKTYVNTAVDTLNTKDAELTTAISSEATAREQADTAINNKIGTVPSDKTVVGMISEAEVAAKSYAETKVNELAAGAVADNTAAISAEETRAKAAEADFERRISTMETFWDTAEDSDEVINKLKEIQDYIKSDETGAATMAGNIQSNTQDITTLKGYFGTGGRVTVAEGEIDTLQAGMTAVENRATQLETKVGNLETLTGTNGTIQTAIRAAQADATSAIDKADAAQTAVDTLNTTVNGTNGVGGVKATADSALQNVTAVESNYVRFDGNKLYVGKSGTDEIIFDCGGAV